MNDESSSASNVLAYCSKRNFKIFITTQGISYLFCKKILPKKKEEKVVADSFVKIDVNLLNAKIEKENVDWVEAKDFAKSNFYNASFKDGMLGLYQFSKIRIRNIYDGVDWILNITDSSFKYTFEVAANVDESKIQLQYVGAEAVSINDLGNLEIKSRFGKLIERDVKSWQANGTLSAKFHLIENNIIGFKINNRNFKNSVTIDPTVVWLTFFGESNTDVANGVTVDGWNNFYVTGYTASTFFPVVNAGTYFSNSLSSTIDAFISKFSPNMHLMWSTFYGGNSDDAGNGIKADNSGNVFVAGYTKSSSFPIFAGTSTYSQTFINKGTSGNFADAFLLKFDATGNRLFSIFFGGGSDDCAHDLTIDNSGNVYVVGKTFSTNFPTQTTSNFFQSSLKGAEDGFVSEFTNTGSLTWSSYFGGNGVDLINSISSDNTGNIFVAGSSSLSTAFPLMNNGNYYQATNNNGDGFIAKFSNNNTLQWSTFYGGKDSDEATSTVIDPSGYVYVAGNTNSTNFSTFCYNNFSFRDSVLNKGSASSFNKDVFLGKFSTAGKLLWATLVGGSGDDGIQVSGTYGGGFDDVINDGLVADNCGNIYLSFYTTSADAPLNSGGCNSYFDNNLSGSSDAFLVKFSKLDELKWGTYFGGSADETGFEMALNSQSSLLTANNTDFYFGYNVAATSASQYVQSGNPSNGRNEDVVLTNFQQPTFDANVTYSNCIGICNGSASVVLNATCNQSAFQYIWSNGVGTASSANNLCNGNYTVIVIDTLYGCNSDTVRFNIHHGIQIAPLFTSQICSHLCNGTATIQVPGISNTFSTWHLNDTTIYNTNSVANLCVGEDTVIVKYLGCGADTAIFTITPSPFIQLFENYYTPGGLLPCPLQCNGIGEVVAVGGMQAPTCIWSDGHVGTTDSNLCAGKVYTVSASDGSCYSTSIQIATAQPLGVLVNYVVNGGCLNNAYVQPINFGNPIFYHWSTGDTTLQVNGLQPGTYTCLVTDTCGDAATVSIVVTHANKYVKIKLTQIRYGCACGNSVKDSVIQAGYPPYTYTWQIVNRHSTFTSSNQTLNNLCGGDTVRLTIKDACGYMDSSTIIIDTNKFKIFAYASTTVATCNNVCKSKGHVYANSNPRLAGNPPYFFVWSNGQTGTTDTNLCPGKTYYVIGYDSCGRRDSFSLVVPTNVPTLNANIYSYPSCAGLCVGHVQVLVGSGVPPYHYHWNTTTQDISYLTGLCLGQQINCIVKDSCGDTLLLKTTIPSNQSLALTMGTSPSCPNFCNGTIYACGSNGMPPYTYTWNTGTIGSSINNACANTTYYCTVHDQCLDSTTQPITVASVYGLHTTFSTSPSCKYFCNGTISAVPAGGLPPYHYHWNTGSYSSTISNACAFTSYYCTVYDNCGDSTIASAQTGINTSFHLSFTSALSCAKICSGQITAVGAGGVGPYFYHWSNGANTATINNVCPNVFYHCMAIDNCGDTLVDSFSCRIINASPLQVSITSIPSCANSCTGHLSVAASGGTQPYTYLWNTGTTTPYINNACSNTNYTCRVIDNCSDSIFASAQCTAHSPLHVSFTSVPLSCASLCNGRLIATASGGMSPYHYYWSNGSSAASITGLCAHVYYKCMVIDNCADTLIDSAFCSISPSNLHNTFTITNNNCANICAAIASISTTGGGGINYSYQWSNGAKSNIASNLCNDSTYQCIVNAVCSSDTLLIHIPKITSYSLNATLTIGDTICNNSCNGRATINVLSGNLPFVFSWNTIYNNNPTKNNCCSGTIYNCSVQDACQQTQNFSFKIPTYQPLNPSLQVISMACDNSCHDIATINATGGKLPYSYVWSNTVMNDTDSILCPGHNFCIITDACNSRDSFSFNLHRSISLQNFITTSPSCEISCTGKAQLSTVGGLSPYKYAWINGDTTSFTSTLCIGKTLCVVKDNCHHADSVFVTIDTLPALKIDSIFSTPTCYNICTGIAMVKVSGGDSIYHYQWNTGSKATNLQSLCAGVYSVIITNPGCMNAILKDTFNLVSTLLSQAKIVAPTKCVGSCDGIATARALGNHAPFTFLWNGNAAQHDSVNNQLCVGKNVVMITDSMGCITTDTLQMTQPQPLAADTILKLAHCTNSDGEIIANGKGGTPPYYYVWSNHVFIDTNKNIPSGNYKLVITDSNGCVSNSIFTLSSLAAKVYVSHDTTVHIGREVNIFAYGTQKYFWKPSTNLSCDTCPSTTWNGTTKQIYCVTGTDEFGCIDSACVTIDLFNICGDLADIHLPNAFTPNGDGMNELFKPIVEQPECFSEIVFKIYNRWGQQLFQANDFNIGWDGTFKAKQQPLDTYVWYLKAKNYLGEEKMMKGDVILIR